MLESCLLLRLYEPRFSSRVGRKGQSHPRRAQVSSDLVLKPERFPTYSHVVEKSHAADQADKAGPKFYRNIENSKVQHEGNGVADKRGDKNKLPVCVNYAEPRYRQINLGSDWPRPHGFLNLSGLMGLITIGHWIVVVGFVAWRCRH